MSLKNNCKCGKFLFNNQNKLKLNNKKLPKKQKTPK